VAVSFGAIGTAGTGTTSCAPSYPTGISATTSVLYCLVTGVSSVAGTAFTGPSGWTSVGQLEDGVGSFAADTGLRRVAWFKKDTVTGSESGTVTFSLAAGGATSTMSAQIVRFVKTAGYTVTEQFASGADNVNNTAFSAITGSLNWTSGDFLAIGVAQNIDSGTPSAQNISALGVTLGTRTNRVSAAVTSGNDHRRILDTVPVTTASTTAAATYSYTISAAGSGPVGLLLLTEAGTPVTVGITGSEIASATGTAAPPPSRGQVATFAQELLSVLGVTVALVGAVVTSETGTVTVNADDTVALSGSAVTTSSGTVSPSWSQALSGSEIANSSGTATPTASLPALTGQLVSFGTGTVSASGNSVTVNISGVEAEVVQGSVTSGETLLSGASATAGAGTVTVSRDVALTGAEITSATGQAAPDQGAVDVYITSSSGVATPSADVALTGSAITAEQGTAEPSADADIPLTGIEITSAAQSIEIDKSFPITGQSIAVEQNNIGAPGGAILSGAEITSAAGSVFLDGDRTLALTGESVSVLDGLAVTSYLAFVDGLELTTAAQEFGPRGVTLDGAEVAVTAGNLFIPVDSTNHAGGRKEKRGRNYIVRGRKYLNIDDEELLQILAQEARDIAREDIKVAFKDKKPHPISKALYDDLKGKLTPEEIDEEEAFLLL
jgi:hypothetical protein